MNAPMSREQLAEVWRRMPVAERRAVAYHANGMRLALVIAAIIERHLREAAVEVIHGLLSISVSTPELQHEAAEARAMFVEASRGLVVHFAQMDLRRAIASHAVILDEFRRRTPPELIDRMVTKRLAEV